MYRDDEKKIKASACGTKDEQDKMSVLKRLAMEQEVKETARMRLMRCLLVWSCIIILWTCYNSRSLRTVT